MNQSFMIYLIVNLTLILVTGIALLLSMWNTKTMQELMNVLGIVILIEAYTNELNIAEDEREFLTICLEKALVKMVNPKLDKEVVFTLTRLCIIKIIQEYITTLGKMRDFTGSNLYTFKRDSLRFDSPRIILAGLFILLVVITLLVDQNLFYLIKYDI